MIKSGSFATHHLFIYIKDLCHLLVTNLLFRDKDGSYQLYFMSESSYFSIYGIQ